MLKKINATVDLGRRRKKNSFFLLAVEREIETKAQTFQYRSLLSEQNQNVLIWSAYYWNKSRTFQSVPKLFKIELERFGVF
jgi:hypothetical protein